MGNFFDAVKAGVRGALSANGRDGYVAAGRPVSCSHCGCQQFVKREAQLNTSGMSLMELGWVNQSGTALVCTNCSLIHWFLEAPERADP